MCLTITYAIYLNITQMTGDGVVVVDNDKDLTLQGSNTCMAD